MRRPRTRAPDGATRASGPREGPARGPRVVVVAEFYPRAADPVPGIWAHRQALAARAAGADVTVLVLHRPVPPRAAFSAGLAEVRRATTSLLSQPSHANLDGLDVRYVRFLAPPRPSSYGRWGAWAAGPLAVALARLRRTFAFELVHAHYAVPAGDAVRRARIAQPLVVSEHGGDLFYTAQRSAAGREAVRRTFAHAQLVLANSQGIERRCREIGARATRVVHLGADVETPAPTPCARPTIVTVGHLVARKRHADVIRALWLLRDRHPELRYLIVGDGPEREALERLAHDLGLADRVELVGQRPHAEAVALARGATIFVMPSVDEAFGVAYVEAMAGGIPAIGARDEPGPEEIMRVGGGLRVVAPGDIEELAAEIAFMLDDADWRRVIGREAAQTAAQFTWARCGVETVAAYRAALR